MWTAQASFSEMLIWYRPYDPQFLECWPIYGPHGPKFSISKLLEISIFQFSTTHQFLDHISEDIFSNNMLVCTVRTILGLQQKLISMIQIYQLSAVCENIAFPYYCKKQLIIWGYDLRSSSLLGGSDKFNGRWYDQISCFAMQSTIHSKVYQHCWRKQNWKGEASRATRYKIHVAADSHTNRIVWPGRHRLVVSMGYQWSSNGIWKREALGCTWRHGAHVSYQPLSVALQSKAMVNKSMTSNCIML